LHSARLGRAKTKAALALELATCQRGHSAAFTRAHEFEARDERRLRALQKRLNTVKLLIVDELGYVPPALDGFKLDV
jgi:DNA replication protein DnaC